MQKTCNAVYTLATKRQESSVNFSSRCVAPRHCSNNSTQLNSTELRLRYSFSLHQYTHTHTSINACMYVRMCVFVCCSFVCEIFRMFLARWRCQTDDAAAWQRWRKRYRDGEVHYLHNFAIILRGGIHCRYVPNFSI